MIHNNTGCSTDEIYKVLNTLGDVVKDKFSDCDDYVEINIFPGLKITSRYIPTEQTVSKNLVIQSKESMYLKASFSKDFRRKIKELHSKYICD
jgi:hypothetical protein